VPIVLKSRSLKLLESSGHVQTCNGIALPLPQMKNVLITDSKYIRPKKTYFKSVTRLSSLITVYINFRLRENNEAKRPDALGSAAQFVYLVQASLAHISFNP
jgi:hypothetical protein